MSLALLFLFTLLYPENSFMDWDLIATGTFKNTHRKTAFTYKRTIVGTGCQMYNNFGIPEVLLSFQ